MQPVSLCFLESHRAMLPPKIRRQRAVAIAELMMTVILMLILFSGLWSIGRLYDDYLRIHRIAHSAILDCQHQSQLNSQAIKRLVESDVRRVFAIPTQTPLADAHFDIVVTPVPTVVPTSVPGGGAQPHYDFYGEDRLSLTITYDNPPNYFLNLSMFYPRITIGPLECTLR